MDARHEEIIGDWCGVVTGRDDSARRRRCVTIDAEEDQPMSSATHKKLLTAEEFFLLPDPEDGSQQELVRGEVITMPPPGGLHGVTCSNVDRKIGVFVDAGPGGTLACNDTGFITERGPDSVRGPAIS